MTGAADPKPDGSAQPTFFELAEAMENVLNHIGKPVIAAVNGICCGGGLELALMCDFILAADGAKIGDAHANFGAMPAAGLVLKTFTAADFEPGVQHTAERIAEKSPLGLKTMKQLIEDGFDMPLEIALRHEKLVSAAHMRSWDAAEGGRAFAEKRKPEFRGY